jgi:hypothetical protein
MPLVEQELLFQVEANFYGSLYVVYHTPIEKFKDTKGVIRSHQSNKTDNTMAQITYL